MKRKAIPKRIRELVYQKYNGHCAYCGCELQYKDMQVDHINSIYLAEIRDEKVDDSIDNYMPSCRQCNFYKSTMTTETFRARLKDTMYKNLQKDFSFRLALKYGLVVEVDKEIKFYFEQYEPSTEVIV